MLDTSNKFIIRLTLNQLLVFGIHIGHSKKLSCFLAGWFLHSWKSNIFIIDLIKGILLVKLGLRMVKSVAKGCRPFWFVTMNDNYAPYLARYAYICGEPFNIYEWIGGTLSNYRMILGWLSLLLLILGKNKYKIRNMDKRNLISLVGYLNKKIYNKIFVKRYNKTKGRHLNRWRKSYNAKKFIKEFKKLKKYYNDREEKDRILNQVVWTEFNDVKVKYRARVKERLRVKFYRRKWKFGDRYINYVEALRQQKLFYSRVLNFLNLMYFKTSLSEEAINYGTFKNYWYVIYKKKLNLKNFFIVRNTFISRFERLKKIMNKIKELRLTVKKKKISRKYYRYFNYINNKWLNIKENHEDCIRFIKNMSKKKRFNTKFLTILLLKGERRILAKIKKLKKNSSFNRALKLNRWISPFDPFTKSRKPGGGFVPTYLDNIRIIDEFAVSKTPFITLVDSNIVSSDVAIPFLSNDDSYKCINFFSYLICKAVFIGKIRFLMKWRYGLVTEQRGDLLKKIVFYYHIKKKYENKQQKLEDKNNFDNKLKFFIDDLVDENIEKFNMSNEIKYNLQHNFDLLYSFTISEVSDEDSDWNFDLYSL